MLCCDYVISSDVNGEECTNDDLDDFKDRLNVQGCDTLNPFSNNLDLDETCNFSCNGGSSRLSSDGESLEKSGITPDNGTARCTENGLVIDADFIYGAVNGGWWERPC